MRAGNDESPGPAELQHYQPSASGNTLSLPKAHQAGGRRGKERAARHERSSDWRRGARSAPPTQRSASNTSARSAPPTQRTNQTRRLRREVRFREFLSNEHDRLPVIDHL